MNLIESFHTATDSIRTNKLRSSLTMLGIIIGVAAVIALTSLGNGFSNLVDGEISANGSNLITISSRTASGYSSLTEADLVALADPANALDVGAVAALAATPAEVRIGDAATLTTVAGATSNYFTTANVSDLSEGALFSSDGGQVALLGAEVADYLFPNGGAVGQAITIDGTDFEVVGVLASETSGDEEGERFGPPPGAPEESRSPFDQGTGDTVYVPLTSAIASLDLPTGANGETTFSSIVATAVDETVVTAATEQIERVLREQHGLGEAANDFSIISQAALADTFSTITSTLTLFLGAIAGISLLVGGIGIMNIMLVSVTERTREIGIRKALGALRRDILTQFLLESLLLSLVGGMAGMLLGWGLSALGGSAIGITAAIDAGMVALAVGFSTAIGVIFGIYPAWQASRLRPIDALRYE